MTRGLFSCFLYDKSIVACVADALTLVYRASAIKFVYNIVFESHTVARTYVGVFDWLVSKVEAALLHQEGQTVLLNAGHALSSMFPLGIVLFVKLKAGQHHLLSTTVKCIQGSS